MSLLPMENNMKNEDVRSSQVSVFRSEKNDVRQFDWSSWSPGVKSTLVFVKHNQNLLLIHKKTGLGQGKINGPGGKVEPNESWIECARREVYEELNIEVGSLHWSAELRFLMSDYPDILCHVFMTDTFSGEPSESREAKPFWCPISEIPYAQMWEDDQYWLPRALLGERVLGLFSFDKDQMLSLAVDRHEHQDDTPPVP